MINIHDFIFIFFSHHYTLNLNFVVTFSAHLFKAQPKQITQRFSTNLINFVKCPKATYIF